MHLGHPPGDAPAAVKKDDAPRETPAAPELRDYLGSLGARLGTKVNQAAVQQATSGTDN